MKAILLRRPGGPEALDYADVPDPVPADGQVLVRAQAIGIGKPDVLWRTGVYRWLPPLPAIPGIEMAGVIERAGCGVSGLAVGEKVLVYHLRGGCYAELIACDASSVLPLPAQIDVDEAVAIPNYEVAWALLNEAARGINPRTIYVNGAAGGVGSAIVQLCRAAGIEVIAGAGSAAKCAFCAGEGAAHTIDYSRENVVERVQALTGGRGVDLILDQVVGGNFTDTLKMMAPLGLIVSYNMLGGFPDKDLFREMRANLPLSPGVRCFTMHSYDHDPAGRRRIETETLALIAAGAVKPVVYRRLPLAEVRRAHELLDAREVMGKLVLKP
ncbi:MAG TPA: zinc-dependent alcohol dehydrogenase family protein [Stellaceae bacterium]|nr:zinc-dependent alcohol dehydrogenase family protein [Stellaceae bacterium]